MGQLSPNAWQFLLQRTTLSQLSCLQETLDRYNLKIDLLTALKECQDSGATWDDCMPILTFSSLPNTQVGYLSYSPWTGPAHTVAPAGFHRQEHMPGVPRCMHSDIMIVSGASAHAITEFLTTAL